MTNLKKLRAQEMIMMKLNGKSLQSIGDQFGLSKERVRQIIADSLGMNQGFQRKPKTLLEKLGVNTATVGNLERMQTRSKTRSQTIVNLYGVTGLTPDQLLGIRDENGKIIKNGSDEVESK